MSIARIETDVSESFSFSWEEIPGNDSERLIDFLKSNYYVDWVKTAKIVKIDNGKTINITDGKNFLSLNLNNENTELNLKFDNVKTYKFILKTENGKLIIYSESIKMLHYNIWLLGEDAYALLDCTLDAGKKEKGKIRIVVSRKIDEKFWVNDVTRVLLEKEFMEYLDNDYKHDYEKNIITFEGEKIRIPTIKIDRVNIQEKYSEIYIEFTAPGHNCPPGYNCPIRFVLLYKMPQFGEKGENKYKVGIEISNGRFMNEQQIRKINTNEALIIAKAKIWIVYPRGMQIIMNSSITLTAYSIKKWRDVEIDKKKAFLFLYNLEDDYKQATIDLKDINQESIPKSYEFLFKYKREYKDNFFKYIAPFYFYACIAIFLGLGTIALMARKEKEDNTFLIFFIVFFFMAAMSIFTLRWFIRLTEVADMD